MEMVEIWPEDLFLEEIGPNVEQMDNINTLMEDLDVMLRNWSDNKQVVSNGSCLVTAK